MEFVVWWGRQLKCMRMNEIQLHKSLERTSQGDTIESGGRGLNSRVVVREGLPEEGTFTAKI